MELKLQMHRNYKLPKHNYYSLNSAKDLKKSKKIKKNKEKNLSS